MLTQYSNQSFHKIKIEAYTIFKSELTIFKYELTQ